MNTHINPALDASDLSPVVGRIPLIPKRTRAHGPLIARRVNRTLAGLILLAIVGGALIYARLSPEWSAAGLSLILPGAGFLAHGGIVGALLFVVALAAFFASLILWWATGNIIAPVVVWFGGAVLSAWWAGPEWSPAWVETGVPALVAILYVAAFIKHRSSFKAAVIRGEQHNEFLSKVKPVVRLAPQVAPPGELSVAQLAVVKATIAKGLQPLDQWEGFTISEQFQMGALRYQLSGASWNLAGVQYSYLPAFHGHLDEAQRRLMLKNLQRKNWDYWYIENLWGHLESNPDPIRKDNVMLSGFMGTSLAMLKIASGIDDFGKKDSLVFEWKDGRKFKYDHHSINQALVHNYHRYDLGWMPCEPNWVYSMCNLLGAVSIQGYDKIYGTNLMGDVRARFEKTMEEELLLADGRLRVCTSSKFGFTVPSLSSMLGETSGIRPLMAIAPDKAERLWQVVRRDFIRLDGNGKLNPRLLDWGWDTRNTGTLKPLPDIAPLGGMLTAAVEMGDKEVIEAASSYLDSTYGAGASAGMMLGRCGTWYEIFNRGRQQAWDTGPILDDAPFSQVLVARAATDGAALELVLRPDGDPRPVELGIAKLLPGKRYNVSGATETEIVPDNRGIARINIDLRDRHEVRITPA